MPAKGASDFAQALEIADADGFAARVDQPELDEARQRVAYSFERHAEIAVDIVTRHAQREFGCGITASREPRGQIEQQMRDPFFRRAACRVASRDSLRD